jgi:hypothetical protein
MANGDTEMDNRLSERQVLLDELIERLRSELRAARNRFLQRLLQALFVLGAIASIIAVLRELFES